MADPRSAADEARARARAENLVRLKLAREEAAQADEAARGAVAVNLAALLVGDRVTALLGSLPENVAAPVREVLALRAARAAARAAAVQEDAAAALNFAEAEAAQRRQMHATVVHDQLFEETGGVEPWAQAALDFQQQRIGAEGRAAAQFLAVARLHRDTAEQLHIAAEQQVVSLRGLARQSVRVGVQVGGPAAAQVGLVGATINTVKTVGHKFGREARVNELERQLGIPAAERSLKGTYFNPVVYIDRLIEEANAPGTQASTTAALLQSFREELLPDVGGPPDPGIVGAVLDPENAVGITQEQKKRAAEKAAQRQAQLQESLRRGPSSLVVPDP